MIAFPTTFTRDYQKWREGDSDAQERLILLVYRDLCRMAQSFLRKERNAASIEPEMLANDVALTLLGTPVINLSDRKHFFLLAARLMRQLLVNYARHRSAQKRGSAIEFLPLDEMKDVFAQNPPCMLELDEALEAFKELDFRAYEVVMLRFFFGLTEDEVVDLLEIGGGAVKNDWKMAKLWLRARLRGQLGH